MSSALRKLRRNVEGRHRTVPLRPLPGSDDEIKMSEVLLDFARPWLDEAADDDQFKKAIGIAALFWNVAMEPEDEQPERLREIARDLGEDAGNDPAIVQYFETLGAALLLRKKTLFPNVRRTILDYKAIGRREYIDLTVYSAPCPASLKADE